MTYALTILGMVTLAVAVHCAFHNRGKAAGLLMMPAIVALLFGAPEGLLNFHAAFASGSLDATFQQKIDNAEKIITQLRLLAVNTAKSLIQLRENSHAVLIDGSNEFAEQDAYKASLINSLRDMGIAPETIRQVEQSDSNVVVQFYSYAAFRFASDGFLPDEKRRQQFDRAFQSLSAEQQHSPDQIQKLYDRFQVNGTKFAPYMEDFRYYVERKEQRRPEAWAVRETWGFGRTSPGSVFPLQTTP